MCLPRSTDRRHTRPICAHVQRLDPLVRELWEPVLHRKVLRRVAKEQVGALDCVALEVVHALVQRGARADHANAEERPEKIVHPTVVNPPSDRMGRWYIICTKFSESL